EILLCMPVIGVTGGTRAQTVTQPEDHISVLEGSPVQVKCNYSSSGSPVLFWYVHYPKQQLQLLLRHTSRESIRGFTADLNKEHQGFQATLVTSDSSFHLQKPSMQASDSAVYYCALSDTVRGAAGGAEHKPKGSRRAEVSSLGRKRYILSLGSVVFI
uniref:Ig-like domain-containing protein n=1 Tax=Phocoena sinus TaxID=42100 RepID=A0A8C9CGU1_PHOSS